MNDYPLIAEHGIVGDLQTVALVSSGGTVDWWCTPRFDSPSIFASLLDSERGGYCSIAADLPAGDDIAVKQLYLSDTAVLLTRFMSHRGVGEVADFMTPLSGATPTDRHRLVRVVRVVRGSLPFTLTCRPRFDYGRGSHTLCPVEDRSVVFRGPGTDLHLQSTELVTLQADDGDIASHFTLATGEIAVVVMTSVASDGPAPAAPSVNRIAEELEACRTFWQSWLRASSYRGRWRDMVNRSVVSLSRCKRIRT